MRRLAAALAVSMPVAASAQAPCGPLDQLAELLEREYGEAVHSEGLADSGAIMQLWANPETGSWSIVIILPDGLACLPAAGSAYSRLEPVRGEAL